MARADEGVKSRLSLIVGKRRCERCRRSWRERDKLISLHL